MPNRSKRYDMRAIVDLRRNNVVKYNIQIKERGVSMKDMSAQKQVCSTGTGGEPAEAMRERSWEYGLPPYLQHDLDAYKEGLAEGSSLLDCLWGELYGSINIAEINDGAITHEHADYLRQKFLWGE